MLKTLVQLEAIVAEKAFRFYCDHDSPIAAVKEALFQLSSHVAKIEEKVAEDAKKAEEEKAKVEVVPQEEVVNVD